MKISPALSSISVLLVIGLCSSSSADEKAGKNYEFKIETIKAQPAMTTRFQVELDPKKIGAKYAEAFGAVFGYVASNGGQVAGAPFGRYHDSKDGKLDIEAGAPVAKVIQGSDTIKASELPGGTVITTIHYGPYEKLGEAHEAMYKWAAENGHKPTGGLWEYYLTDPTLEKDQSKWQTKVQLPVAGKSKP